MSDTRVRLNLSWRMLVAVGTLVALSAPIAITAVAFTGTVVLVALLVATFLLGGFTGEGTRVVDAVYSQRLVIILLTGTLVSPFVYLRPVRREIRAFREELGATGTPADSRDEKRAATVRRLAQQADIQPPTLYIENRSRPESYAVGGRSNGTIIVTRGLVRQLSDEEVEAVLAHEVAHLANGDSRIMSLALVPLLVAEHVGRDGPPSKRTFLKEPVSVTIYTVLWAVVTAVTRVQAVWSQVGVAALSRGREVGADRAGARLSGNPAALASALETLSDDRSRPAEDKRTWVQSAGVLDILPPETDQSPSPWFRTHPPTEKRIEQLQELAIEAERTGP